MTEQPRASSGKRSKRAADAAEVKALQKELGRSNLIVAQLRQEIAELSDRCREVDHAKTTVAELSRELHNRTIRMEQQLLVARQFQRLFLPVALPSIPEVKFSVRYTAAPRVGGDLYDVFDMGNSCVGIFVADVSGYGLAATLVTAVAKMALNTFRQNEYSPQAILEKVNTQMLHNTLESQFLTGFLAVLDVETMKMKYVNASHPCPVVIGPDRFEMLDTEGLCCGMFEDPRYEEKEVQLRLGDQVFFFTRGLLEMTNAEERNLPVERLHEMLRGIKGDAEAVVEQTLAAFQTHMNGAEQTEDLTLIAMQVTPRETREERIVIPSEPMQINRIENHILERLEALNYGERVIFGVRLAIEEAVINAIKHGNKMDKAKNVIVTYSVDPEECVINVEDEGDGFDPNAVPDPTSDENLELPHGRGLVLIRAYMDDVSYNNTGNRITMRKKAPWRE